MTKSRKSRALAIVTATLASTWTPVLAADTTCPATSDPKAWTGVLLDTETSRSGVAFDDSSGAKLRLEQAAGVFRSTTLGITDLTVFAAVADFDRDGWDDFVGVGEATGFTRIYENRTYQNPAPNWDDPNAVRTPKFVMVRELTSATASTRWRPTAAADFNGDGWPDVFRAVAEQYAEPSSATLWLNNAANDASGAPTFRAGYSPMVNASSLSALGAQTWGGTSIQALDYNGDRKIDLLVGSGYNNGTIRVFLNNCTTATGTQPAAPAPLRCSNDPKFTYASTLITNMGFPATANLAVFKFEDVDGDGKRDLIAGAPSCCSNAALRLRLWKGVDGGGINPSTYQSITFPGAATAVLVADFSGDGKKDLIVGTDNWNYNSGNGGHSVYWVNNGTGTPFTGSGTTLTTNDNPTYDFDVGFVFNYDNDPSNTPDLMIADGNHTASFYVFANRVVKQYVPCGEAASGTLDLGPLASSEMVVTAARIDPDYTLNGGTLQFFLSNEEPPNWILATDCGDGSGDLCASFLKPVGREVRWKAVMCSNSARTLTPELRSVDMTFDYTQAREHFRAGATVSQGVVYFGGFRQPGDRGNLYAVNAALDQTYWNAAAGIDAMADSERRIYTSTDAGNVRLDFSVANASSTQLQDVLDAADQAQAAQVIAWVRSKRFGVGNVHVPLSRLGAIETSTPAVLTRPGLPLWYAYASITDKARYDAFRASQANRRDLVLFGAKDGMIHAIMTTPHDVVSASNGREAWAFVPPNTAGGMIADYTASLSAGRTEIGSYPDGSPTLVDFRRTDGSYATAAIVASGNGGKSLIALDVTETVDPDTGSIIGPTPMWTATPGDADAGQAYAKPAVARVLVGGAERYFVIAGTGMAFDNPAPPWQRGRVVAAYDLATGERVWQFKAACPITSDISVFETHDDLEPGEPTLNGYIDRAVFADACGHVYKVDPAVDLDGGWNDNRALGTFQVDDLAGVKQMALFSTRSTAGALGAEAPIAGTMAVRRDGTGRVALFFGTGGIESAPITTPNEFYAVYADTGAIRSKVVGNCSNNSCEKFYGGVVVTAEQVIFTRTKDPVIGTSTCDLGSTVVDGMRLDADAGGEFEVDFTLSLGAAVMGALYGDAGALYFASLSGDVSRIGTPAQLYAGDTSGGPLPEWGDATESDAIIGMADRLNLLGWLEVF